MKISTKDFRGTGQVYRFTLGQMLKGKANIITLFMILLVAACSIPVMTLMMGGEKKTASNITTVYVKNDTPYELVLEKAAMKNDIFANTLFTFLDEEPEVKELSSSEVYVQIKKNLMSLEMMAYTAEQKDFSMAELSECTDVLSTLLDEARLKKQNASAEQIALLTSGYDTKTESIGEYLEDKRDDFDTRFGVQMVYSILVITLCTFVSSYIVQKVIEEKASKLAELLMVSVKPLAMLLGKILAVMTYVFGLMALFIAVLGVSYVITGRFADTSVLAQQLASMGITADSLRMTPMTMVVVVVSLLLGYCMFSLISGMMGTGCSTMEDAEPANLTVVMLVMTGYMAASVTAAFDSRAVITAVTLIPVVSMFCAPTRYLMGDIGLGMLGLSWLIQIIVIVLLAYLCAKIYRDLMMYRGNRMKPGGWIKMFRQNRTREVQR